MPIYDQFKPPLTYEEAIVQEYFESLGLDILSEEGLLRDFVVFLKSVRRQVGASSEDLFSQAGLDAFVNLVKDDLYGEVKEIFDDYGVDELYDAISELSDRGRL